MRDAQKSELALQACDEHHEEYGQKVPARILRFWSDGEAWKHDGHCIPAGKKIPLFEDGSFRLAAIPPSWALLGTMGGLDDALSGPDGEWRHAGKFLPLFAAEQGKVVVARLDNPECPIGWYEDETFDTKDKAYKDGVFPLAPSLDDFLRMLVDLEEADYETDQDDTLWDDYAESAEDADDDDEDEDD